MASYSVARAKHATLSTTTVDTVTLTGQHQAIEVVNRSGTADIYFAIGGAVPTAGGDDTYIVPAGTALTVDVGSGDGGLIIKLIGSGNAYTVGEASL